MPALETIYRNQQAALWQITGVDQSGEEQFALPINIRVRWIQKQSKVTDAKGNTTILDGKVVFNQEVPLRSAMWLGSTLDPVSEYTALQNAGTPDRNVMRVETADYTPDVKGRNTEYEFGLKRYKDATMPVFTGNHLILLGGGNLRLLNGNLLSLLGS